MHLSVALVQLDATDDVAANIATAVALADEAAAGGARLVALPEYLQFRGPDDGYPGLGATDPGPAHGPVRRGGASARRLDPGRQHGRDERRPAIARTTRPS